MLHQPVGHREPRGGVVELDVAGERRVARKHDRRGEHRVHRARRADRPPVRAGGPRSGSDDSRRRQPPAPAPAGSASSAVASQAVAMCAATSTTAKPAGASRAPGQPDAGQPARAAGRSRATPPSPRAETGASRREERSWSRAPCIRARGRRLRYRVGRTCPLRASRRALRRRGVVDLDLHVAAREREVHAVRLVAAVDGESAPGDRKRHRIGAPRQLSQQPRSARGRGYEPIVRKSGRSDRRPARPAAGSGRRRSRPWGASAHMCGPRGGRPSTPDGPSDPGACAAPAG